MSPGTETRGRTMQIERSTTTSLRDELREATARGMAIAVHARVAPERPALVSAAGSRSFG